MQVIAGSQVFGGDTVLCTVPLSVLKKGSIKFILELPQRRLDGIKRLGFGLVNKVAMLFPHVFWKMDLDFPEWIGGGRWWGRGRAYFRFLARWQILLGWGVGSFFFLIFLNNFHNVKFMKNTFVSQLGYSLMVSSEI